MSTENTITSRKFSSENDTAAINSNNDNNEEKNTGRQRAGWTYARDLIYMKGMVECYPPIQGHGNVTQAWKNIQAAVNNVDQDQGQLKNTTIKFRATALVEGYKERRARQQEESNVIMQDFTDLDEWIEKFIAMLESIAEKKGKRKENSQEQSEEHTLAEQSTTGKRPTDVVDNDNAKRTKVISEIQVIQKDNDISFDQKLKLNMLEEMKKQTETMTEIKTSVVAMTKILENGFQSMSNSLSRMANGLPKPKPKPVPRYQRHIIPVPIQKKYDNNNNNDDDNNNK